MQNGGKRQKQGNKKSTYILTGIQADLKRLNRLHHWKAARTMEDDVRAAAFIGKALLKTTRADQGEANRNKGLSPDSQDSSK